LGRRYSNTLTFFRGLLTGVGCRPQIERADILGFKNLLQGTGTTPSETVVYNNFLNLMVFLQMGSGETFHQEKAIGPAQAGTRNREDLPR